ncbi:MAG: peptide deformylase [Sphingomonadales bacterium]|nr:peptide deformylase [Sphingomonadales bacterium]
MILPIVLYGDPVLQRRAEEVPADFPGLDELVQNMFETMYAANGIGLAAPQIGYSLRLFILDAELADETLYKDEKRVFINPLVLEENGETWPYAEGCLSIPEIRGDITRRATIRLRYEDAQRKVYEETFDGMLARIIQHEYDHIEGRLFIDLLSPLRRRLVQKKLQLIRNGKLRPEYKHRPR